MCWVEGILIEWEAVDDDGLFMEWKEVEGMRELVNLGMCCSAQSTTKIEAIANARR